MRSKWALSLLLVSFVAQPAFAYGGWSGRERVSVGRYDATHALSNGYAAYMDLPNGPIWAPPRYSGTLQVVHEIREDASAVTANKKTVSSRMEYNGGITGPAFAPHCYRGRLQYIAQVGFPPYDTRELGSTQLCWVDEPPPPPSSTCKEPAADGTCPPTGSSCLPEDETCQLSPIILNLGSGGYRLSGPDDPVTFDLDADGRADRVTWTERGAQGMAFLALDRNGDGLIENGAELFGDSTPLPAGGKATNGFEALRPYDTNGDRLIDARDAIWSRLLLWVDANHNGISEPSEITALAASDVVWLGIDYLWTRRQDDSGNTFRYAGVLRLRSGVRPYYDIFFTRVP